MKILIFLFIAILIFLLAGIRLQAQDERRVPVIVELFTSEGCNTCPPADKYLQKLAKEQPVDGVEIIPLQEHVDYWNRHGWIDPFSSAQFSNRQGYYAIHFKYPEIFTPNLIVDGTKELRGKDGDKPIVEAGRAAKGKVAITIEKEAKTSITINIKVTGLLAVDPNRKTVLLIAVTENNLVSNVSAGENKGSVFKHMAVTRYLKAVGEVKGREAMLTAVIPISGNWKRDDLTIVAFVQDVESRLIIAAGKL